MNDFSQSEGYTPENDHSEQQAGNDNVYKRRVQKFSKDLIEGKWTEQQNLKYILYMDYYSKIFVSKQKRKSERIFQSLSKFLVTRTPRQCRSHFQKLMNKFKKLKKVKQFYQEELGIQKYEERYEILVNQLKPSNIKVEETQQSKCNTFVTTEVQTDPMTINLTDLSNMQLMKLMNLLNQYHQIQVPMWLGNPLQCQLNPKSNVQL